MNFLPEKKYGVPSWNFVEKNVLCEKGDDITRFDGTFNSWVAKFHEARKFYQPVIFYVIFLLT
jgi:hypothetical protein